MALFPSRSSGGLQLGSGSSTTAFERDLARVRARKARLRRLDLRRKQKADENSWFLDRFIPDKVEQGVNEVAESLIYTIPGMYEMGKTVAQDTGDLFLRGDITPERSARMFAAMGTQMAQDLRHPLRHPGYTAMTLFGLASMGLGSAARVGTAAGAYARLRPASAAARSLSKLEHMPRSASGAIFHAVPPSMRPKISLGPERPRGNQDPTVPEVHEAQGATQPTPNRGQMNFVARRTARNQLKSLEQLMDSPGYTPNLVDMATRRELRAKLNIPEDPHPVDVAIEGLPTMTPADRRTYLEEQRAVPTGNRQSSIVQPDQAGLAYQQERLAARQQRVQQRRAAEEQTAAARQAQIDQLGLEIQMQQLGGRLGLPEMPEGVGISQLLPEGLPMLPRATTTQVAPPGGLPAIGEQLSLLGGERLPDPGALTPPLSREAGRDLSMGILRPPPPRAKAPAKTARSPVEAAPAVAAVPDPAAPAGPIDYDALAAAIAARMGADGGMAPEGSFVDVEEPRTPGRPRQEGDFSGPQKAEMTEIAKSWEHTRTDDGGWDITWAGLPAGRIERALDKNGEEMVYPSITKEGQAENRRKYEIQMINPRRTRSGRPFSTKRTITAATDAEAAQIARRLWAEWVVAGRTGGHPKPEGAPLKTSHTRPGKFTGKKPGDVVEDYWALRAAEEAKADPASQGVEPAEKIPAVGKSEKQILEDAQAEMDMEKARLQQELDAIDGPSDADLAAIEDDALGVDPAPPVKPAKAKAKAKAVKGEPLEALDVTALNADLDPQLRALGLHYNDQGYLAISDDFGTEDVLTDLGLDPGEAYLVEDALNTAAGKADPGGKFSVKEFHKALLENFPDEGEADVIFNKIFGASGGTQGALGREMLRAFFAPRPRQTTSLAARLPVMEGGHRVFKEVTRDEILLSNNPVVRFAWYTTYGALKALENPYAQGGRGNFASRQLRRKIGFETGEIQRINELAEKAGISKEASRYEQMLEEAKRTDWNGNPVRVWDTVNRGAMMGILFLKPAYLTANMIGQVGLAMIDHAWNPANIYRSVQLQRELYRNPALQGMRAGKIKRAMGEGAMESLSAGPGASKRIFQVHDWTSRQYAKLLDTPFRDNAFINEAIRGGFDTPEKLAKLVDAAPDSALGRKFTETARRANRNMIDYGRMNNVEKQLVRRILIFYPWLKGASIYGARFAAEHPAQFTAAVQMGRIGAEESDRDLGQLPSFMQQQGVFKVGERNVPGLGRVPEIMNPAAISILGTPGETLSMARAALLGNVRQSEELAESITPAATAALTAFTGTDPFTGAKADPNQSWLERISGSLADTLPFVRQAKQIERARDIESGAKDPREVLQPMDVQDVAGRWLGPGLGAAVGRPYGEFALNPREASQRAAAESRTFESKSEAQLSLHRGYRDRAKEEAKRLGIDLPPAFDKALMQRAQREAEIVAARENSNGDLDAFGRLEADMRLLVRRKEYTQAEAKQILNRFAEMSEGSINQFRRQLGDAFFGGDVRSYYKKLLNAAGASIDQSW